MPLNLHSIDYTKIPLQTNDYSGLTDLVKNFMEGYELSQKPQKLRSEAEKLKQEALQAAHKTTSMGNEAKYSEQSYRGKAGQEEMLAEILRKYGGAEKESEIEARLAQAFHHRQSGENAGQRGVSGRASNPYYGIPEIGKLMIQQKEIDSGFLPGSNRTDPLTPEQQKKYSNQNQLAIQKLVSDSQTRSRTLFASNIEKAFNSTKPDDLVKFSGPSGQLKLKSEQAKDLVGQSSEEYKKYKEALVASELEAKEIRQFFGSSITPEIDKQLRKLTNPTSWSTSPEVAKREIQQTRNIIRKQLKTYQEALRGPQSYREEIPVENTTSGGIGNETHPSAYSDDEMATAEKYGIPVEQVRADMQAYLRRAQ